jgi:pimeloyl-ACP methyl ester carboxylesterase
VKRFLIGGAVIAVLFSGVVAIVTTQLSAIGAGALLFPARHVTARSMPHGCSERKFSGVDVVLDGWECRTANTHRRGTIIYLHGVADNRGSSISTIEMFRPIGFDVVAYDARAHGTSQGERCTYGYYEKRDVQRVIDQLGVDGVILIGHSLGAAVALQAAAIEPRVKAVVAASTFSDLRTIATERAIYFPTWSLGPAFARAEHDGRFVVDDVSPVKAAARITVPVLLFHGAQDRDTVPAHSVRVFAALKSPKQLVLVQGHSHNDVMTPAVMIQIKEWIEARY